jgi:hypothetical protein
VANIHVLASAPGFVPPAEAYFTRAVAARLRDHKDWRVTVLPPYALVVFILMSLLAALVLGNVFSPNVGWLFVCVTMGMYLIYELEALQGENAGRCNCEDHEAD